MWQLKSLSTNNTTNSDLSNIQLLNHTSLLEQVNAESSLSLSSPFSMITNEDKSKLPSIILKQCQQKEAPFEQFESINSNSKVQSNSNLINLVCHINPTQYKFILRIGTNECVGDLRAIIREIILRNIQTAIDDKRHHSSTSSSSSPVTISKYIFNNNKLSVIKDDESNLDFNPLYNSMTSGLLKNIIDNEDNFYIKLYTNSNEIIQPPPPPPPPQSLSPKTTSNDGLSSFNSATCINPSGSLLADMKFLSDLDFKDTQSIYISLYCSTNVSNNNNNNKNKTNRLCKECIPMVILSKQEHFNRLLNLLNVLSELEISLDLKNRNNNDNESSVTNENDTSEFLHSKSKYLASKVWQVIGMLPTNRIIYDLIIKRPDWYLEQMTLAFSTCSKKNQMIHFSSDNETPSFNLHFPYQLLYFLQIIMIINNNEQNVTSIDKHLWPNHLYKLLVAISNELTFQFDDENTNKPVLFEYFLITLKLFSSHLFQIEVNKNEIHLNNHKHQLATKDDTTNQIDGETVCKKLKLTNDHLEISNLNLNLFYFKEENLKKNRKKNE
jgi:hypothetical protein